jgi:anti-sigma factor RsiW
MNAWTTFGSCDRAREAISRAIDDDLSPFEARLLASHLDECGECREFHGGAAAMAASLRTAPMEHLEQPVTLPPRRMLRPLHGSAAAAIAAAAVLVLSVVGPANFNRVPDVQLTAPSTQPSKSRIVPDGVPFPADRPASVRRKADTIEE